MGAVSGGRSQKANYMNSSCKRIAAAFERFAPAIESSPALVELLGLSRTCCVYCGRAVQTRNVDELIPVTKAGRLNRLNCVPCCGSCNSSKSAKMGLDFELWLVTRAAIDSDRTLRIAEYVDQHLADLRFGGDTLVSWETARARESERYDRLEADAATALADDVQQLSAEGG